MEEILASLMSADGSNEQCCPHYGFLNNSCTGCKQTVDNCNNPTTLPFRFIHCDLSLTQDAIRRLRDLDLQKLLHSKRLHLVLDLDNTLIHTKINKNILKKKKNTENNKSANEDDDVYEIFGGQALVKLRPGARNFLDKVSQLFDLTIYTMATRDYAREIVQILESGPVHFSRVICREDCTKMYRKSLDIVLSHQRVVLVVDDLDWVWSTEDRSNLIRIKPYKFFRKATASSSHDDDEELSRVLSLLKEVHTKFYDEEQEKDCASQDVRRLLGTKLEFSLSRTTTILTSVLILSFVLPIFTSKF